MAFTMVQQSFQLTARERGCHLITKEILAKVQKQLATFSVGMCNVFLKHTSASLCLNENADP